MRGGCNVWPVQFTASAEDRGAAQAGHLSHQRHTASSTLLGQEPDEQTPVAFIRNGHEPVDVSMLLGHSAVGMPFTRRTPTRMYNPSFMLCRHSRLPP